MKILEIAMIYELMQEQLEQSLKDCIAICKSSSGVEGAKLRLAHYQLGRELVLRNVQLFDDSNVVVCFMRAALPFAMGIVDAIDSTILFFNNNEDENFFERNDYFIRGKDVILVDSVINSGESMLNSYQKIKDSAQSVKIMANVMCDKAKSKFTDKDVFVVRISENSFKGTKVKKQSGNVGPDTGDRLFKTFD